MRVLVIGAYGFIGSGIARRLLASGHSVVGFARSVATGQRLIPDIDWIEGDLNRLTHTSCWLPHLEGIDAVVNAGGALQSGAGDRLRAIHGDSIVALIEACEQTGAARFVQISAPGATLADSSHFLSTKAVADERLRSSTLQWSILRPGLVVGRNAYGGTLLVRALATTPLLCFTVHGSASIQTVALEDVVEAVERCLLVSGPQPIDIDLVSAPRLSLTEVIAQHRRWLSIRPAFAAIDLPPFIATAVGWCADALGVLGWRSPLRSNAMGMIARGVTGDATQGAALLGRPMLTLGQTLARNPSGIQDRWHGRLVLMMPFLIFALSLLFLLSGIASLVQIDRVTQELNGTPAENMARILGVMGSMADIALGLGILVRRWARTAAMGMALLTGAYLLMGSWLRPDLWMDPYAPLAKAVTALVLAIMAAAVLEER